MKKAIILFLTLIFMTCLMTACNHQPKDELPIMDYILPEMPIIELESEEGLFDDVSHDAIEENQPNKFVSLLKIHEDMPEFTITLIAGDFMCASLEHTIPLPVEVSIVIEDSENNIIQTLTGLSVSNGYFNPSLSFDDYNFDGYLDMRLMRWQDGIGGLLANEYFWLWDNEIAQFVLNEQLMEIEQAGLHADQEDRQIVVRQRTGGGSSRLLFYEYHEGTFTLEEIYYMDMPSVNP